MTVDEAAASPPPAPAPASTSKRAVKWIAAILVAAVIGAAVYVFSRGGFTPQQSAQEVIVTSTVTGEEQVVDAGDGVNVRLTAGALPAGSTLTTRTTADVSDGLPAEAVVSPVTLEVTSSAGQPTGPVTVELPFDPALVTSSPLILHKHGDDIWLPERTKVDGSTASATIDSFSKFSVGDAWNAFTGMVGSVGDAIQSAVGNNTVPINECTNELAPWLSDAVFHDDWKTALHTCAAGGDDKSAYVMVGNNRSLPVYVSVDKPYSVSIVWPGDYTNLPERILTTVATGNAKGKSAAGDRFLLPGRAVARVEIPRPKRIPESLKIAITPDAFSDGIPVVSSVLNLAGAFVSMDPDGFESAGLIYNCLGDVGRAESVTDATAAAVRSCAVEASESALDQIAKKDGDVYDRFVAAMPDAGQRKVAVAKASDAAKVLRLWTVSKQFLDAVRLRADQTTNTASTLFISPKLLTSPSDPSDDAVKTEESEEPPDVATQPAQPASPQPQNGSGSGGFDVGDSGTYRCAVAWPFAPSRSQSAVSFRSTCSGQPHAILFVDITVPDANYTPPGGRQFTVTGQIVDKVRSDYGFQTLQLLADIRPDQ